MFKRILIILSLLFFAFSFSESLFAACDFNSWDVKSSLDWCLENSNSLVTTNGWDLKVEWGFKDKINNWIKNIAGMLWLVAIWAIVYAWLMMTLSSWDDEKIKKSKDIVKWAVLGFLWVVWASALIAIIINVFYSISLDI